MPAKEKKSYISKKSFDVPTLKSDGSNYRPWKYRQELVLRVRGLDEIAFGSEPQPEPPTGADAKDAGKMEEYTLTLADWLERDQEALAQIALTIEDEALGDIVDAKTCHEAWTRIVERWEGKGAQSLSFLYHQPNLTTKIEEDSSITTGVNGLRSIASKMKTLGKPVSDSMFAQILMNALPPSYAVVSTVLQTSNQMGTITSDMVVTAALAEEERRKQGVGLTAMFTSVAKGKNAASLKSNDKPKKKNIKCFNCGKLGHIKVQCHGQGGGAEGKASPQNQQAAKDKEKAKTSDSAPKPESAHIAVTSVAADNVPVMPTLYALPVVDEETAAHNWLLDSGASRHMTPQREWFSTYRNLVPPIPIRVGDGSKIDAIGIGRIHVTMRNRKGRNTNSFIDAALHVPDLNASLMSVTQLTNKNTNVLFQKGIGAVMISQNGQGDEIGWAKQSGQLYIVQAKVIRTDPTAHTAIVESDSQNDESDLHAQEFVAYTATTVARADLPTCHRRSGHLNYEYVLDMVRKSAVEGMDIVGSRSPPESKCAPCLQGKQTRAPFPLSESRTSEVLELLHSDLHGPLPVQALGGIRYFAVTIDDKSRKIFVHLLRNKSDYPGYFKQLKASVENLTGKTIKRLRTDGGGEYGSNAFEAFLSSAGIQHQKTEADSSASNGVAERAIRTLNDCQRAMRFDAQLPEKFWGYAILHAAHLWNITPKRRLNGQTPNEIFSGTIPNVSGLRTFGCKASARVPDSMRTKLQARSFECNYLGFAPNRKAHILLQRGTGRVFTSRDVVFDEGADNRQRVIIEDNDGSLDDDDDPKPDRMSPVRITVNPEKTPEEPPEPSEPEHIPEVLGEPPTESSKGSDSEPEVEEIVALDPDTPIIRRSTRVRRPPERYGAPVGAMAQLAACDTEQALNAMLESPPETFQEAMRRPDANLWLEAMIEELKSIEQHQVWTLVDRPVGKNIVKCRWVFDYKRDSDGEIIRHKARLVGKGFSQRPGVDYVEISSPVAAADSLRTLLSIVAALDLELLQIDVKTAFLHAELEEEIFMEQPPGFSEGAMSVWKLNKAIYGLKQAARAFYLCLKAILENIGFHRCDTDHSVFWLREGDELAIILGHVDDMLLAGTSTAFLEKIKSKIAESLEIVDLGEAKMFVGIEIERDRSAGTLKISQRRYINDILARFGMSDCKTCDTPMAESLYLPKLDSPSIDRTLYQQLVGSLMYAMISTRADIAFPTGLLAQYAANPGKEHWDAGKRVLRYLKGTSNLGIVYHRSSDLKLLGYVDADYAGDKNTSRSTTGWAFLLAGGVIAYSSRKQPTISLSSTEAEYVADASAARELIWIRQFLSELGFLPEGATPLLSDNQSAMALAKNPINHQTTKHIRVKYHFIREVIALKELDLQYVSTEDQVADALTKALGRVKFTRFVSARPETSLRKSINRFPTRGWCVDACLCLERLRYQLLKSLDNSGDVDSVPFSKDPDSASIKFAEQGDLFYEQYTVTNDLDKLDAAIDSYKQAVLHAAQDNAEVPKLVGNLGFFYSARHLNCGRLVDIDLSIIYNTQALSLTPRDHQGRPARLNNLGSSYLSRYYILSHRSAIGVPIHGGQDPISPQVGSQVESPAWLATPDISCQNACKHLGELADLDMAIVYTRRAVSLVAITDPDVAAFHNNLGSSYSARYAHSRVPEDADLAIRHIEQALSLTPDGTPEKPTWLNNLGQIHWSRFEDQGLKHHLDEAIECVTLAISLIPDQESSEHLHIKNFLGTLLCSRYKLLGDQSDIHTTIQTLEKSVPRIPKNHTAYFRSLTNLSAAHEQNFRFSSNLENLDSAIQYLDELVSLIPEAKDDHGRLYVTRLGILRWYRLKRLDQREDLDEMMSLFRRSILLLKDKDPDSDMFRSSRDCI
ncbi:Copia-like polyprotein/retrotransposon [Ceratobasidium sp. AG-Ba]|nr:Copia-like polyprotein/retrotransposon [Ceratobasidium sp. AG-Ba]